MSSSAKGSHQVAEEVLSGLKEADLPPTPRNFELWHLHVDGRNPALSRDLQRATDAFGKVSQRKADDIYRIHVQNAELSRSVIDIATKFHAEVADLYDLLAKSGEHASGNTETLTDLSDQLRQTSEEYPAVGKLLESVFAVAKDMRVQNQELETRLADSATEIAVLQRNVESIQAEAMKDPLTGVANRAMFDRTMQEQMAKAASSGKPLALVLADIDFFKQFNDRWGHQTGDQVLRLVAEVMNANVKGQDLLARYGGEEFAILLPGTTLENAHMLADRIRRAVESRRLKKRLSAEDLGNITMSMGVALFRRADTAETLIERADECLYAAKDHGRNRVVNENDEDGLLEGAA